MKAILFFLILIFFFSCSTNENNNNLKIKISPDGQKYEYQNLKNGLVKIIRFYQGTMDTLSVYFLNKNNHLDSTAYFYYRNGKLKNITKYFNNKKIRKFKHFYKNGNINREFTIYKDSLLLGEDKYYYENGKLWAIQEFVVFKDSISQLNSELYYNKSGNLIIDSTFYFEIITKKDTISLNDSLKVGFKVIKPKTKRAIAFHGSIDNYFRDKLPPDSLILKDSIFYFKPKKLGKNLIEIVFLYFIEPKNKSKPYIRIFLKKDIFVTT